MQQDFGGPTSFRARHLEKGLSLETVKKVSREGKGPASECYQTEREKSRAKQTEGATDRGGSGLCGRVIGLLIGTIRRRSSLSTEARNLSPTAGKGAPEMEH